MIQPDALGYYHPVNESDITDIIQYAIKNNYQVRVRGAAQSVNGAIYTDQFSPTQSPPNTTGNINIMLDKMRTVTALPNNQVKVQAGCNLGYDPFDPTDTSTPLNSLFYELNQLGLSIPDVSDAIHQTVGGFMSTGSSGGTLSHSLLNSILSISLIDGTGKLQTFTKPSPDNPNDPFYGVVISLGLLGIITEVTFQCSPIYNIIGTQNIDPDISGPVDFFNNRKDGSPSVQQFFETAEYSRMIWFPYYTVKRLMTWQARCMTPADYNAETGTPADFKPKPYKDIFPAILGSEFPSQLFADGFFSLIGNWPQILIDLMGNGQPNPISPTDETTTQEIIDIVNKIGPKVLPSLLSVFIPLDDGKPPQQFWNNWYDGLDMDAKEYDNNLFPSMRTELWFPMDQAANVMAIFENYFDINNTVDSFWVEANQINRNQTNGCYPLEIHAAQATSFWLSPGYSQPSLRINLMWFSNNQGDPYAYYQQFWDLFKNKGMNYKLHWGYCLPASTSAESASYITGQYPKFSNFMQLRNSMDPHNIFLTSYWKLQLGLT